MITYRAREQRTTQLIIVLIPAHNEESEIAETLQSVLSQSLPTDKIIVIADNCVDETIIISNRMGVEVFETVGNQHKKAGALNQWLDANLDNLSENDQILVMDADTILDKNFLANASREIDKGYAACGGVFSGKPGGGFVGMLQRNEYARYARDVARKHGKTLVLTGTATLFKVDCLKNVIEARKLGLIPRKGSEPVDNPSVYDIKVLTEDNELTFALLHLGYRIIAPAYCKLQTEVMPTWRALWRQRLRWKRGAIENNVQYGLTRHTLKYWGLQIWGTIGILFVITYLTTLVYAIFAVGHIDIRPIWMLVSVVYILERAITVKQRGWKQSLLASVLVVEMGFDFYLQAVHIKAICDALMRTERKW